LLTGCTAKQQLIIVGLFDLFRTHHATYQHTRRLLHCLAVALLKQLPSEHCTLFVLPRSDADLNLAASAIIKGGFSYSGQRCTAVKLVLVVKEVADELVKKVRCKTLSSMLCTAFCKA
jgi:hypothetical protein